jgi:hypothetical protein
MKPMGKGRLHLFTISAAATGKELIAMRAMFVTWLTLIAVGLVFYSVIGLSHN